MQLKLPHLISSRAVTCVTVAPAALTLVLGGAFLGRAPMWEDEATTWFYATQPVSHIIRDSASVEVVFLPYYLFMHFWVGVSQSMWWMRLPSLLAGAAAVAALVLLARRWLPLGWSVLAGFLLALNPLFAGQVIQARPYTAAALFAVVSTAALVKAIDRGGRRRWVLYGLASLCMHLFHLLAAFVLAAHVAGVAIARRRSALPGLISAIACVAVVVSPVAVIARSRLSWIEPSTLSTFHTALVDVSGGGRVQELALVICGIIVAAHLAYAPARSDRTLGSALSLTWGAVPVLLLVSVGFVHPDYVDRYAVVCLPGVALIETFGLWRVSVFLAANGSADETSAPAKQAPAGAFFIPRHHRHSWVFVMATITCVAAIFAGLGLLTHTSQVLRRPYHIDDFRSAAAALSSDLQERPARVAVMPDFAGVGFSYYVTPPALAHALDGLTIRVDNRHYIDWLGGSASDGSPRSVAVVGSPIEAKPESPATRCVAGWAIGWGAAPSKPFIIDGSGCQLYRIRYYGAAWVASLSG